MNGEEKRIKQKGTVCLIVLLVLAVGAGIAVAAGRKVEPHAYAVRGFSNMCPYEGKVYGGVNSIYGDRIALQTSIFTIQDSYIYYVEKVQEAFESATDELYQICRSRMDGTDRKVLVSDVFLPGMGHEKLIGGKLFYGCGYDENERMQYAVYDIATGKKGKIKSGRIENILGYDGNYLYYSGYDTRKEKNMLGRIFLKTGKDETLVFGADTDEPGYMDTVLFENGSFYCLTLSDKPEGYDYRTYTYYIEVRDARTGEAERKLSVPFTGSSNYSFLIQDEKLYYTAAGNVMEYSLLQDGGKEQKITGMKPEEYWGILHFLPGDGYLYYEAIAEINEETGNNDYFYRVPEKGGVPELLKEWFTQ